MLISCTCSSDSSGRPPASVTTSRPAAIASRADCVKCRIGDCRRLAPRNENLISNRAGGLAGTTSAVVLKSTRSSGPFNTVSPFRAGCGVTTFVAAMLAGG